MKKSFISAIFFRGWLGAMWREKGRKEPRGKLAGPSRPRENRGGFDDPISCGRDEEGGGFEGREHRGKEEAENDQRRQHEHHLPSSTGRLPHRRLVVSHRRPCDTATSPHHPPNRSIFGVCGSGNSMNFSLVVPVVVEKACLASCRCS